jgi:Na+-translocating ferredoxin:NAD+ oxidoreductase RnfD subunit
MPLGLAILGAAVALSGSGFTIWPFALAWMALLAVIVVGPVIIDLDRQMRVFVDFVALVAALTVFAALGGWWFVPAIVAQLLVDVSLARRKAAGPQVTFTDAD